MCGFAGAVRLDGLRDDPVSRMTDTLIHRGPDDQGSFRDAFAALGHRRLSIIDLSPAGRQPLENEDGSIHVAFNGEIYGHLALRRELEEKGHRFRSKTDSEAILHLYEEHGEKLLDHMDGMFAFALWDSGRRRLLLARDPMGKKPLYYSLLPRGILFGSELKALGAHPEVSRAVSQQALHSYLFLGYVPGDEAILEGARKLPPGSLAVFDDSGFRVERYFEPRVQEGPFEREAEEYEEQLMFLLRTAVRRRLVADVEVGVFLSGGIDSSLIAALIADERGRFKTFSMGFTESAFDESRHAHRVAKTLGTEHIAEVVDARTLSGSLSEACRAFDEPFADASAIPSFLLAKMTARHVKVVLGGDGGDELFGGYPTLRAQRVADWIQCTAPFRPALRRAAEILREGPGYYSAGYVARRFFDSYALPAWERQLRWTCYLGPEELALMEPSLGRIPDTVARAAARAAGATSCETSRNLDQRFYLPDDILVKADRSSMGNSLEVRSPFLDRDLVAFANRLPGDLARGKVLLKRMLRKTPVGFIARRSKHGFAVPVSDWLRGELKSWARSRLDAVGDLGLRREGAERLWREHQDGTRDRWREIWALAVLMEWRERSK